LSFGPLPFFCADHNYKYVLPMFNPNDYLTFLNTTKSFVKFKPGEEFMYTNDFYEVAGLVIQSQIKGTYEDFIIDKIMKPLGMDNDLTDTLGRGVLGIMLGEEPATVLPKLPIMQKLEPILGTYTDHTGTSNASVEFVNPVLMMTQKTADNA